MLAALGELPPDDARELDRHLVHCPDCRALLADYLRIVMEDLPLVAASRTDEMLLPASENVEIQKALDQVLRAAERRMIDQPRQPLEMPPLAASAHEPDSYWRTRLLYLAAALVLSCGVAASYRAYRIFERDTQHSNLAMLLETEYWKRQATAASAQQRATELALRQTQKNADTARASLQKEQAHEADLIQQQKNLEERIAADIAAFNLQSHQLQLAQASLEQDQKAQKAMASEIQTLKTLPKEQPRNALAYLTPHFMHTEPAVKSEPKVTESEARDLFGARDLHIVDVVDVNSSGNTRKIYGRVYCVGRRLLLFYAFDLMDPRRERKAVGFQAWGFRQPNSSNPENLGMFYVDDASAGRWVLKVTNTALLARIDTVFVTAEPPEGSSFPSTKKILFASLAGPPNHP
jgi:hypothetical protein